MSKPGVVTSFSPHNGADIFIGGMPYHVQNADKSWSFTNPAPDTLRFELRSGDVWDEDPGYKERSGVSGESFFAAGKTIDITYDFMIEPGAANTSDWVVIGQLHAADGFSSPPFAVELIGEQLAIKLRYKVPGGEYQEQYVFIDDQPIVRGKYYHLHAVLDFDAHDNAGAADVWLDDEHIGDYSGYLGFGAGYYWKADVYRAASLETIAINFRDMVIAGDLGVEIYGTRKGDEISSDSRLSGQPKQTNKGDIIYGEEGKDKIIGRKGNDILIGGDGKDDLKGGKGDDTLAGGPGKDKLKGGGGHDVFFFKEGGGKDKIIDFKDGVDAIAIPLELIPDHAEIANYIEKVKGGVILDIPGGGEVFLKNVKPAQLTDKNDVLLV
ncbi:MAG: heparin lyase I family protein [Bauldia sp.]|nr:heparin lyase I family protein [Bauldia sp.]